MKKILLLICLLTLTGCQNPAKNLKTNIFGDLWDKWVIQKDTDLIKNRSSVLDSLNNYQEFEKLNDDLENLREFLINGGYETDTKIPLEKNNEKFMLKDLNNLFCKEVFKDDKVEKLDCFSQGPVDNSPVFCFDRNNEPAKNINEIKYCEFRGKNKFNEGLMKISDKNNETVIQELQNSLQIFQKNSSNKKSLEKELQLLKKNIKTTCLKQRVSLSCGFQ